MHRLVIVTAILFGCGGPAKPTGTIGTTAPTTVPSSSELTPALAPLAWWLGDWEGEHGNEHWVAVSGAMYGVGFTKDGGFEVMIVDDGHGPGKPDGVLRFFAMPNGGNQVEFRKRELGKKTVRFTNDGHDFPKNVAYRADGTGLAAEIYGDEATVKRIGYTFRPGKREPALELEAADRAFAEDTAKRGLDGWIAGFADDAGMLQDGKRIQGHAAIGAMMGPLLASGKLAWTPIASGKSGELGFTVGRGTFTGAKAEDSWKSSYVTIWKRTRDGQWKVWFDTGRVVNE